MKTLYEELGVDRRAPIAEIALRYREHLNRHIVGNNNRPLSKKDQQRLKRKRDAYLLLASPSRRREYDLQLEQAEWERIRLLERIGVAVCVAMLAVGVVLIASGFYSLERKGMHLAQLASMEKTIGDVYSNLPFVTTATDSQK